MINNIRQRYIRLNQSQLAFTFQIAANVQIESESPEEMGVRFRHGELEKEHIWAIKA